MTRELKPEELRAICDPATLPFDSTTELPPLDGMIGQDRAMSATAFGIGMRRAGYNLFVVGAARTGRTSTMHRVLTRTAREAATPWDYCYVYNFADPYRPAALELPAGRARELAEEMTRLVQECRTRLPRAFEEQEFERQKAHIVDELGRHQQSEMVALETAAREAGFAVLKTPGGLAVAPAPRGEPLTGAEFLALPEAERNAIEARGKDLEARVEATLRQLRQHERDARAAHETLVREVAAAAVRRLVRELHERFAGLQPVERYLASVEGDLIAHAEEFRQLEDAKAPLPFLPPPEAFLDRYRVNVLVDRTGAQGAPVVVEPNPTHANLFGRLEHRVHFGTLVTDSTLIKPGALHQANGGYLVLEATDVLRALMAWDALKKALKSRSIRLEDPLDELRLVSTVSLAPEPIPLAVKVIYRRIREQLGPGEVEATERGTAAVFHALRDRLTPPEADQVAAQLPALLKDVWTAGERVEREPTKLHRSEFLERIRQDAGLMTARQAEWLTVAVFSALKTQLSEGEAEDVVAQLPKDLKELWVEAP